MIIRAANDIAIFTPAYSLKYCRYHFIACLCNQSFFIMILFTDANSQERLVLAMNLIVERFNQNVAIEIPYTVLFILFVNNSPMLIINS